MNSYILSHVEMPKVPVYFDMPSNYTVSDVRVESVLIKTSGNGKKQGDQKLSVHLTSVL